jgi:hypothetical protein
VDIIDMHNHFIAPEIIDFLTREGKHFATRIVERDGRRFFLIQEKAMRPIDGPISNAQAIGESKRGISKDPRARKECIDENHLRRPQESGSLPRWHTT